MTGGRAREQAAERTVGAGLTYEHVAWAVIAGIALAMRLAQLDAAPLTTSEAKEAVLAWRAATGEGMPVATYNPLLFAANTLLFTLFGASDSVARLLPALCGVGLVLSPTLIRCHLGRTGALISGLYLAISPTALVASRQLNGAVAGALGALVFLGSVVRFAETRRPAWLSLAGGGLALGVTGGVAVYGLLLPLALAYILLSPRALDVLPAVPGEVASGVLRHTPRLLLAFVIGALLLSTGMGWNLPGIGASGGLLAAWLGRFGVASGTVAGPLTLLTAYELGAVVFGIGGVIWGALRRDPVALLLGAWAGLAILLLALMPGRAPTDLLWAVVPLAMLVGLVTEDLVDQGAYQRGLRAVHLAIVLILWGHAYLMLGRYAQFGAQVDLALALVTVLLQGLVGLSLGLVVGWEATFRTAAWGTGVVLLALALSVASGVAYRRPADPREALLHEPTPVNVRDLVETLEGISWQETGLATTLALTVEAPPDSVVAWYLRGFDQARRVDHLAELPADQVGSVLVTVGRDDPAIPSFGVSYAGQDFPIRRRWAPAQLTCRFWEPRCKAAFAWFLFREGPPLPEADGWATVWRAVGGPSDGEPGSVSE